MIILVWLTSFIACFDGYAPEISDGEFAEKTVLEGGESCYEEGDWYRKTDNDDDGYWLEEGIATIKTQRFFRVLLKYAMNKTTTVMD